MVILLLLALLAFILGVTAYFYYFRLWFRAYLASVHVPLLALVGMTLRKVNPRAIVDAYIAAVQAGSSLTLRDIEEHYRAGESMPDLIQAHSAAREVDGRRARLDDGAAEAAGSGAFEDAHTSP